MKLIPKIVSLEVFVHSQCEKANMFRIRIINKKNNPTKCFHSSSEWCSYKHLGQTQPEGPII